MLSSESIIQMEFRCMFLLEFIIVNELIFTQYQIISTLKKNNKKWSVKDLTMEEW